MIWALLRVLVVPLLFGASIVLVAAVVYWGLDVLLASHTDHSRGLWEGSVTVLVINESHRLSQRVLRRSEALKKEVSS
jgi:hypothetical protein